MPLHQWKAFRKLAACKDAFIKGDELELMRAIHICAKHGLAMPEWVSEAYSTAFDKIANADAKSWGAVFGSPYPKGAHLAAIRKKKLNMGKVWLEVECGLGMVPGTAIDERLFEQIGNKLGLGKTLVAEYYYEARGTWWLW